jgi:hypothetical protein
MRFADICLMASFLVLVVIVAKMLRAIRLLDGRVTLLQEQVTYGRTTGPRTAADKPAALKPPPSKTPIEGVPIMSAVATPRRTPPGDPPAEATHLPGEAAPHVIDEAEAEAVWARMEAEQERMRKAMGRDFQERTTKRSASDIRGVTVRRSMSSQEIARKIERR